MKLVVAGSRFMDREIVYGEIVKLRSENHEISKATEIVSGVCSGSDMAGEDYADFYGIPKKRFRANWNDLDHPLAVIKTRKDGTKYNAAAGPIRNKEMAKYGDALLLIWDGESSGSASMKREMKKLGKPVFEVLLKE